LTQPEAFGVWHRDWSAPLEVRPFARHGDWSAPSEVRPLERCGDWSAALESRPLEGCGDWSAALERRPLERRGDWFAPFEVRPLERSIAVTGSAGWPIDLRQGRKLGLNLCDGKEQMRAIRKAKGDEQKKRRKCRRKA
jgi:hypothetical protein